MKVSIFNNIKAKTPQETSLDDIVRIMKSSERLHLLCERRKELLKVGKKKEADIVKTKMIPAFAPCALMYNGKARKDVTGLTDLCFLDIDHISVDEVESAINILSKDEHVLLAARSMSGDGIHFLIKYAFKDMEQPWIGTMTQTRMNFVYGCVFNTFRRYYRNLLNQNIDKSGANMERLCTISYDEKLHYNPNANPFLMEYEKRKCSKVHHPYRLLNLDNEEKVVIN